MSKTKKEELLHKVLEKLDHGEYINDLIDQGIVDVHPTVGGERITVEGCDCDIIWDASEDEYQIAK